MKMDLFCILLRNLKKHYKLTDQRSAIQFQIEKTFVLCFWKYALETTDWNVRNDQRAIPLKLKDKMTEAATGINQY